MANPPSNGSWGATRSPPTKKCDITNDPNEWSDDPRYFVGLLKRIVRFSVESVQIIQALLALDEAK